MLDGFHYIPSVCRYFLYIIISIKTNTAAIFLLIAPAQLVIQELISPFLLQTDPLPLFVSQRLSTHNRQTRQCLLEQHGAKVFAKYLPQHQGYLNPCVEKRFLLDGWDRGHQEDILL